MVVSKDLSQLSINKEKWFEFLEFEPHEGQDDLFGSLARFKVWVCGRRWGKSLSAARWAELKILIPGTRGWVVSSTYDLTRKVIREIYSDLVVKLMKPAGLQLIRDVQTGPIILEFPWGSSLEGKSCDQPNSLIGEGLDWLVFDEAAKSKQKIWEYYLRPTLTDRKGQALFITTPNGYNWIYDLWKRGKDPDFPEWESHSSPSWANPHLPKEDIDEAERTLSDAAFRQEYGAEFTIYAGQVYKEFDEDVHVVPESELRIDPNWPKFRAIDFGYENPFVCLYITLDESDRVIVYDEYYVRHRTVEQHARELRKDDFNAGYEYTVCDPSGASARATLLENGIPTLAYKSAVEHGLEAVRQVLRKREDGTPGFLISSKCVNTIQEFNLYSYPDIDKRTSEEPVKEYDHACLAGDTLVDTTQGKIPIEDISEGDLVLTRKGYKRVVSSGCTGVRSVVKVEFANGTTLIGTPDHPVQTKDGQVLLGELLYGDVVHSVEDFDPQVRRRQICRQSWRLKAWSLVGSCSGVIRWLMDFRRGHTLLQTVSTVKRVLDGYMKKSGNRHMGMFQKALTYIILTLTHRIMSCRTSHVCHGESTRNSMQRGHVGFLSPCRRQPAKLQNDGIVQSREGNSIGVLGQWRMLMRPLELTSVFSVGGSFQVGSWANHRNTVRTTANLPIGEGRGRTTSCGSASFAVQNSPQTNTRRPEPARVVAVENCEGRRAVYNLEVEGEHEFFANGILTHNCDALRYFVVNWKRGYTTQRTGVYA